MARVYLAVARGPVGFNKLVVVKRIRPELAADQEFLGMFLDESRIAVRLHHPNVVHTHEVFEEENQHVLVLEYLEGHTLAELLRRVGRAQMPLEEHLWVLTQVLAGLHYAHQLADYDGQPLGIIHRDVSPSNVFITYDGAVKLMDFGIAKAAGAVSSTERGTVKGKLGYGAPEQFRAQKVDARADVYSVGVMLWEALARRRRKTAETRPAIIEARVAGHEPKIREVCPEAPATLAELTDRATALDPRHRPPTAAALQFQIERYLAGCPRQAGRPELGELMGRLFRTERVNMRQRIEKQLADPTAATLHEGTPTAPRGTPSSSTPMPALASDSSSSQPPSHSQIYSLEAPTLPTTWNQHRRWLVGGGVAAAIALSLILIAVSGDDTPKTRAQVKESPRPPAVAVDRTGRGTATGRTPAPTNVANLTGVIPAPGPDLRQASTAQGTMDLSIRVEPRNATVRLDEERIDANPYKATVPRDGRPHRVRASAPGFVSVERKLSFDGDATVEIVLRPEGRSSSSSSGRPRSISAGSDLSPRVPPPLGESSRAPRIEPGGDLPPPERAPPKRQLDEQDPYK